MRRRLALAVALLVGCGFPAAAQARVLLNGTLDLEGWATDTGSNLLTRNAGAPAGAARLQLWGAIEVARGAVVYALGEGDWRQGEGREAELEMAGVRLTRGRLTFDAGQITSPIGGFAARRFSWRNPLIGEPDGYPVTYPYGAILTGTFSWFDARAGVLSLPAWHEGYAPEPDHSARPVIAVGVTPTMGVRIGASYSEGPYLNAGLGPVHLAGRSWRAYEQRLAGVELAASAGYLELHGEAARSSYDVPGRDAIQGTTYYGEGKYTFSPRFFVAVRLERNDYPFIRAAAGGTWVARRTDFRNEELGIGVRITAGSLVKASYRQDTWKVNDANRAFVGPGGRAFALQLSHRFDVISWFDR